MQVTTNEEITLRDYQQETLDSIRTKYDNGQNRLLAVKATGMGKTVEFSHLPAVFPDLIPYGMLVIVHTTELAYQAQETLQWVCPHLRIDLEKAEYQADPTADIIVTSRQTLGRSMGRLMRLLRHRKFGIVVTDEAHHVKPGGTYDNILSPLGVGTRDDVSDKLPNGQPRLSLGVTATPNRNDKVGLSHFFGQIASNYDLRYGIEQGYLCDIQALQVDTDAHIENVSTSAGDFAVGELASATNTDQRNEIIVNAWGQYVQKPAIAFCVDVQHAHDLAAVFRAAGVSATAVDGKTPKDERDEMIREYRSGSIQVITNCQVLTEGFDAPGTHAILMARPTRSTPLYIQMLGRGTRTMPASIGNLPTRQGRLQAIENSEKPYMTLIDFCDIAGNHDIVRAPNLFGLSSDFSDGGDQRMVQDTVRRVEEIIEENPYKEEEIREAQTFEEMEVQAAEITVFDVADTSADIKKISDYRWMKMGVGSYQLSVPAERQFDVRLEENDLEQWECSVHYPTQYVGEGSDRRKVQGESFDRNDPYETVEEAIQDVDRRVSREHGDLNKIMEHTASWHSERATRGQKGFLDRLGVNYPSDISKGDASALIDAKKALLRREKDSGKVAA